MLLLCHVSYLGGGGGGLRGKHVVVISYNTSRNLRDKNVVVTCCCHVVIHI